MIAAINTRNTPDVVNANTAFLLKELEMEFQWDRKLHTEAAVSDTEQKRAEAGTVSNEAPSGDGGELLLAVQQERVPELTPEGQTRLLERAEALYGAVAEAEADAGDHALNQLA